MATKRAQRKLTQRGEQRRNALLESALKLFGEKGYRATTVDDIAASAKTGKGTFYWYWSGKEELFHELLSRKFESYLATMNAVDEMDIPASEKIAMIIHRSAAWTANSPRNSV